MLALRVYNYSLAQLISSHKWFQKIIKKYHQVAFNVFFSYMSVLLLENQICGILAVNSGFVVMFLHLILFFSKVFILINTTKYPLSCCFICQCICFLHTIFPVLELCFLSLFICESNKEIIIYSFLGISLVGNCRLFFFPIFITCHRGALLEQTLIVDKVFIWKHHHSL